VAGKGRRSFGVPQDDGRGSSVESFSFPVSALCILHSFILHSSFPFSPPPCVSSSKTTLTNRQWVAFDGPRGVFSSSVPRETPADPCRLDQPIRRRRATRARSNATTAVWEIELPSRRGTPVDIDGKEFTGRSAGQRPRRGTPAGDGVRPPRSPMTPRRSRLLAVDQADQVTELQNTLHAQLLRRPRPAARCVPRRANFRG